MSKRFIFILFLFFSPILATAFGSEIVERFVRFKHTVLYDYLLHKTLRSFYHLSDAVQLSLEEGKGLIYGPLFSSQQWIEELYRDRRLSGAHMVINGRHYRVGSGFFPATPTKTSGFSIDKNGSIHYTFSGLNGTLSADVVLNLTELKDLFDDLNRIPSAVFLYDKESGFFSTLLGDDHALSLISVDDFLGKGEMILFMGIGKVSLMTTHNLEDSGIYLVAFYPVKVGNRGVMLYGLIVIVILVILLLVYTIIYIKESYTAFAAKMPRVSGSPAAEKLDIVHEIDREVSIASEGPKETEAVLSEEKIKELEEDGIFVKR